MYKIAKINHDNTDNGHLLSILTCTSIEILAKIQNLGLWMIITDGHFELESLYAAEEWRYVNVKTDSISECSKKCRALFSEKTLKSHLICYKIRFMFSRLLLKANFSILWKQRDMTNASHLHVRIRLVGQLLMRTAPCPRVFQTDIMKVWAHCHLKK